MLGVCANGVTQCVVSGAPTCNATIKPSAEKCDNLDNDCNGMVDDGDGLCPSGQVCVQGKCIGPCSNTEFPCGPPLVCTNGLCVDPSCVGVTCKAGQICQSGTCVGGCEGVKCPANQQCQLGVCVDPCAGVTCKGAVCVQGVCVQSCMCQPCGAGQVCTAERRLRRQRLRRDHLRHRTGLQRRSVRRRLCRRGLPRGRRLPQRPVRPAAAARIDRKRWNDGNRRNHRNDGCWWDRRDHRNGRQRHRWQRDRRRRRHHGGYGRHDDNVRKRRHRAAPRGRRRRVLLRLGRPRSRRTSRRADAVGARPRCDRAAPPRAPLGRPPSRFVASWRSLGDSRAGPCARVAPATSAESSGVRSRSCGRPFLDPQRPAGAPPADARHPGGRRGRGRREIRG